MRFARILCCAALAVCAFGVRAQQVMLDKVVAVVGGSSITYSEVENTARRLTESRREQGYTSDRDPMNEALEQLMMQKLLYNQALIDSVEIMKTDIMARVEEEVQDMIAREGTIPAVEAKMHNPIFNIRENLRRRYEEEAYASGMQREVIGKVTIIPGEVERFYRQTDKDSLPVIGDQYVYAHITKFPKSIDEAKRRARERLLEMRERIITGDAKFDLLARIYSVDGSALHGGEMEPATLQTFVQPFADALSELKPGQISEVVETQYGFHLIQLIDKKGNLYHCRHILIRPTYTTEELSEPDRQLDSIAELIRADSLTFEEAALRFSDDPYSRQNGGIVTNHELLEHYNANDARYTATKFLKEDFGNMGPSAIADFRTLSQLKVGDISPAYQTQDMNGNQLSKIVKLVQISDTVMTMSITAFESWIVNMLAEAIARKVEDLLINGTGSSQPKGIENANTWGATNSVTVAKTGALTAANVQTLIGLLPSGYDRNGKFVMNKKTLFTDFMPLQDNSKNHIVTVQNNAYFVYGYPVLLSDYVADHEAFLGDFKKVCANLAENIGVKSAYDIDTNSYKYSGIAIFDCAPAIGEAIVKLVKATT